MNKNKFLLLTVFLLSTFIKSFEQKNLAIKLDLNYSDKKGHCFMNASMDCKSFPILTNKHIWDIYKNSNPDDFNKDEWKIYNKDDYILLIPVNCISGLNLKGFINDQSQLEADLNHKSKINKLINYFSVIKNDLLFGAFLSIKSNTFLKLFKQLMDSDEAKRCKWNIYIVGHGSPLRPQICGLVENIFLEFVNFLETQINTNALYYNSCFAAGKKYDYVFKNKKYSFPIISGCLNDMQTCSHKNFDFNNLFENLCRLDINKPQTIKNLVSNIFEQYEDIGTNPMNIINIRLPNKEEFEVIEDDKNITLASKLNNDNKNIEAKYLIFDISNFTNTLNLNANNRIVSYLKGDSYHYIDRIHAPDINMYKLISNFFSPWIPFYKKIFLIREINCLDGNNQLRKFNNVIFSLGSSTPYNTKKKVCEAFFIAGNEAYVVRYKRFYCGCGDYTDGCYRFYPNKIDENMKKKYIDLYNNSKLEIENNRQPIRKIYNQNLRKSYDFKCQIYDFSPVLIGGLLYGLVSNKKLQNNEFIKNSKNLFITFGLTKFFYNQFLYRKINKYLDNLIEN